MVEDLEQVGLPHAFAITFLQAMGETVYNGLTEKFNLFMRGSPEKGGQCLFEQRIYRSWNVLHIWPTVWHANLVPSWALPS